VLSTRVQLSCNVTTYDVPYEYDPIIIIILSSCVVKITECILKFPIHMHFLSCHTSHHHHHIIIIIAFSYGFFFNIWLTLTRESAALQEESINMYVISIYTLQLHRSSTHLSDSFSSWPKMTHLLSIIGFKHQEAFKVV